MSDDYRIHIQRTGEDGDRFWRFSRGPFCINEDLGNDIMISYQVLVIYIPGILYLDTHIDI